MNAPRNEMDITKFVQQAEAMNLRLTSLYQHANALPLKLDILPQAFMELGRNSINDFW
jgi:hypothetical protein